MFAVPNLPLLLPDETLYSWAGYVHAWNGVADVRETSRRLYGSPYSALLHDFPANLNQLSINLEGSLGQPRQLALRHTLLGYFLPVVPTEPASEILKRTLDGAYSDIKMKLGIPASRVGGFHPLKACHTCIEEDQRNGGRAYWHVEHQFPSVLVCVKHQNLLCSINDATTPVHRREWILPSKGLERQWNQLPTVDSTQLCRLIRLATYSTAWAQLEPSSLNRSQLARTYQTRFRQRGWLTASGSLRLSSLVSAVRSHFKGLEVFPGLAPLSSIRADWPGLVGSLARTAPRNGHPLKHLLLISMLFDDWSDFEIAYSQHVEVEVLPKVQPKSDGDQTSALVKEFTRLVEQGDLSVTAASKQLGVSVATGVRWAKILGLHFTPRSKYLSDDVLEVVRSLLRVGKEKKEICGASGITLVSLNRLISSEPATAGLWRLAREARTRSQNRALFTKAIQTHPDWTVKQIRGIPNNGYMWLYRHDRQWLLENLPGIWSVPNEGE